MKDMSMRITPSRVASCSAFQYGNQFCRPHESALGSAARPLGGAYQSAPSQPLTSRKYAPRAARRSCMGERFAPRAVSIERVG